MAKETKDDIDWEALDKIVDSVIAEDAEVIDNTYLGKVDDKEQ